MSEFTQEELEWGRRMFLLQPESPFGAFAECRPANMEVERLNDLFDAVAKEFRIDFTTNPFASRPCTVNTHPSGARTSGEKCKVEALAVQGETKVILLTIEPAFVNQDQLKGLIQELHRLLSEMEIRDVHNA